MANAAIQPVVLKGAIQTAATPLTQTVSMYNFPRFRCKPGISYPPGLHKLRPTHEQSNSSTDDVYIEPQTPQSTTQ